MTDEHGEPLDVERLPGRRAMAGEQPEPLVVRSRMAGDARVALGAREGDARCSTPTAACGSRST